MRLTGLPPIALRLPSSRARTAPARSYPPEPPVGLTEVMDFGANPGALRMFLHIPHGLPEAAPLVVILHGCGQTAGGYDHGAGWSALGDRLGFAVLAPEQTNSNNMAGCFNWFQPGDTARGAGEAASIHQMIVRALADYRLDEKARLHHRPVGRRRHDGGDAGGLIPRFSQAGRSSPAFPMGLLPMYPKR